MPIILASDARVFVWWDKKKGVTDPHRQRPYSQSLGDRKARQARFSGEESLYPELRADAGEAP
ncbi:MAG: hypothetical protein ABR556_04975 [Pyrinomonadaceae bacterium]